MRPLTFSGFAFRRQLRNRDGAHHGVDGDEEEVSLTDGAAFPIRLAHRLSGELDTGGVVGREDDLAGHFEEVALTGWSDKGQGIDRNGHEFTMRELCTSDAAGFVHQGEQPSAEQRVVGVGVLREDFLDEGHGFNRERLHTRSLRPSVMKPRHQGRLNTRLLRLRHHGGVPRPEVRRCSRPRLDREGIGFDHAMESGTESGANVAVVRTVIDVCPLFANRQV